MKVREAFKANPDDRCLKALRVVANSILPINREALSWARDENVLLKAIELAGKNRVLLAFHEGLSKLGLNACERLKEMVRREARRKEIFEKALEEIAKASERNGIEFMVFKSIKPFPYVGDDIDVFTPNNEEFKMFMGLLRCLGYRSLGGGPPEETVAKRVQGVSVMIDVHRAFSASYIPYVDGARVWRRRVKRRLNGFDVFAPSMEDEILILVGHSLLKEFRVNLAELFHAVMLFLKADWNELSKLALAEKMSYALRIFTYIARHVYETIYHKTFPFSDFNVLSDGYLLKVAFKVIENDLKNGINMPYYYPLPLPSIAYLSKLKESIVGGGRESLNTLLCFIKAPFTSEEGVNVLWKYIINHVI
jgi:hypothetical protein